MLIIVLGFGLAFFKESRQNVDLKYYGIEEPNIIQLAEKYGVTKFDIEQFLEKLREESVPYDKLPNKLDKIATEYLDMEKKIISLATRNIALQSENGEVEKKLKQAKISLHLGKIEEAESF